MKITTFLIIFLLFLTGCVSADPITTSPSAQTTYTEVYFCPRDNCSIQLINQIDNAESSIHTAIYSFTLDSIADAMIIAKSRGVDVKIVVDRSQASSKYAEDDRLLEAGIPLKYAGFSGLMHNKFTVVDGSIVSTGSFNYSQNGDTKNNENLLIIYDEKVAGEYEEEFQRLWEQSIDESFLDQAS